MLPAVQQREMREQRAVERRRRMEEERKARIFDAKNRIMGIDRDALSQQVEEKERAKLLEKERAQLYGTTRCRSLLWILLQSSPAHPRPCPNRLSLR